MRLSVPARPELLRLTRVTAAGLASRLGFSFDEVEDLRLAIDELCYGLTGPQGRPGTVEIRYDLSPECLIVEGEGRFDDARPPAALSELSEIMLSALVDEHQLSSGPDGPQFRLVKRAQAPQGAMLNGSFTGGGPGSQSTGGGRGSQSADPKGGG